MRRILLTSITTLLASLCLRGQELSELAQPPNGDNQKAKVSQWIGPVVVSIAYHGPRVHF